MRRERKVAKVEKNEIGIIGKTLFRMRLRRNRASFSQLILSVFAAWITLTTILTLIDDRNGQNTEHKSNKNVSNTHPGQNAAHKSDDQRPTLYTPSLHQQQGEVPWRPNGPPHVEAENVVAPMLPAGPGEMGAAVTLGNLSMDQQELHDKLWERNQLNEYVSDMISLHRSLPDVRDSGCKEVRYPINKMPQASVIVSFHNEAFSILMRTVHSILDRSPPELLKEIILVDDFSDVPSLGRQLEEYISHLKKVKLVRLKKWEGLIRGRLTGARHATAPVLIFLDSHCECSPGWLEPMVYRIYQNETNVVVPTIKIIDDRTLKFSVDAHSITAVGGFDWNLIFNWHTAPMYEIQRREHSWDPIRSPTMAGGLFGISKSFFEHIGTYDPQMDFWGGENLELSFKTWLCGGTLESLPCSNVGHIFRKHSPHKWQGKDTVRRNCLRLAMVWLDDYAKYYFQRIGEENVKKENYGDISQRLALKKRLKCKPFSHFINNVWPEIFIPGECVAIGEIRNKGSGNATCLDRMGEKPGQVVKMYQCHGMRGNQFWMYTRNDEIRYDEHCLDYVPGHTDIVLQTCHGQFGNQVFHYNEDNHLVYHNVSRKCMEMLEDRQTITMRPCDHTNARQFWYFEKYNATLRTAPQRLPSAKAPVPVK